tara:strand:- start:687 stop:830 length:144 start_codon:yes stop_codon:yes gene_type:complete
MLDHEKEEYVNEDTELDLDEDFNVSELDDDFVWHPAMQDGFNVEFSR